MAPLPVELKPSPLPQPLSRNALRLPILHEYPEHPDETECKAVLPSIGYDLTLQGSRNGTKFVLRQCLPAGWMLVTGVIGKCLGHKTGSLNQLNLFEMRILLAVVKNRQLDFPGLIFDHPVETISGKQRPAYVTFQGWISLCLQHIGTGYTDEPEDELAFATMSSRLINTVPKDGDPHLTRRMLA